MPQIFRNIQAKFTDLVMKSCMCRKIIIIVICLNICDIHPHPFSSLVFNCIPILCYCVLYQHVSTLLSLFTSVYLLSTMFMIVIRVTEGIPIPLAWDVCYLKPRAMLEPPIDMCSRQNIFNRVKHA